MGNPGRRAPSRASGKTLTSVAALATFLSIVPTTVLAPPAQAASFVVDSNFDTIDAGDGFTTLREAIQQANSAPGADQISFIEPMVISLTSDLPTISDTVTVDNATVGIVEIRATGANVGFVVAASGTVIRNLAITDYTNAGIQVQAPNVQIRQNLFRGNGHGVTLDAASAGSLVALNTITGLGATPPPSSGIFLSGTDGAIVDQNFVGGLAVGVRMSNDADSNQVRGNDLRGSGNTLGLAGIEVQSGSSGNTFAANVVGFAPVGIRLTGSSTDSNVIDGNFVGTDATGSAPRPNGTGIEVQSASNTLSANVVSGNTGDGIVISGSGNTVTDNLVGVDAAGIGANGNGGAGIVFAEAPETSLSGAAIGNTVANNDDDGIVVTGIDASVNIAQNSIHSNGGLGIDLVGGVETEDGVTANDGDDEDSGPNGLANTPIPVDLGGGVLEATVDGNPDVTGNFRLELFSVGACDPSGWGEGDTFVAGKSITANNGDVEGRFTGLDTGTYTLTARDPLGNTSEFSECVDVVADDVPPFGDYDLRTWTGPDHHPNSNGDPWQVASDGSSVFQEPNGSLSVFAGPVQALGTHTVRITQAPADNDDFFGFVLGYDSGDITEADADYLVVDWKKAQQSINFGVDTNNVDPCNHGDETPEAFTAPAGLVLSRVRGVVTADELFSHSDLPNCTEAGGSVELVATADTLGSVGWVADHEYVFDVQLTGTRLLIWVDGSLEFDVPVPAGFSTADLIGFWNFSQPNTTYAIEPGPTKAVGAFDVTDLTINGSATAPSTVGGSNADLQLTPPLGGQAGSAFLTSPVAFPGTGTIESAFRFQITETTAWGGQLADDSGDGLAFVLATTPEALGVGGARMGVPDSSISVEFDTFDNVTATPGSTDPSGNHVGVNVVGGSPGIPLNSLEATDVTGPGFDDGSTWSAWVDLDPTTRIIDVYVAQGSEAAKPPAPTLSTALPESAIALFTEGQAYLGFSSGTGAANARHTVLDWNVDIAGAPPPSPVTFTARSFASEFGSNRVDGLDFIPFTAIDPLADLRPGSVGSIGAGISSIGAAISSIGAPISSIGAAISSIGAPISSIGAAISSIGAPISSIAIVASGAAISSIGAPISSIGAAISSIGAPISSIPLTNGDSWETLLVDTVYEGVPLQSIAFGDVLANAPEVIRDLTFADFDFSRTEIASLSVASLTVGNLTLADVGVSCSDVGLTTACDGGTTIVDADLAGGDIAAIGAAISSIPVTQFDLDEQPIGSITIGAIGAGISSIHLPLAFDCATVDCSDIAELTLAEAQGAGLIDASLTMGELYLLILPVQVYDWTEFDVTSVSSPDLGSRVRYELAFSQTSTNPTAVVDVDLPDGFVYVPGSAAVCSTQAECGAPNQPTESPAGLQFIVPTGAVDRYELSFDIAVNVVPTGTHTSGVLVEVDDATSQILGGAPVVVTDTYENNDSPGSARLVGDDGLIISYITDPDDEDYFRFAIPDGTAATVLLGNLSEDLDLIYFEDAGQDPSPRAPSDFGPTTPTVDDEGAHLGGTPLDSEAASDVGIDSTGAGISSIGGAISSIGASISSISTNRGTADEKVVGTVSDGGTEATIRVAGYNGVSSTSPYVAQILLQGATSASCGGIDLNTGTVGAVGTIPAGTEHVILWNRQRTTALANQAGEAGESAAEAVEVALDMLAAELGSAAVVAVDAHGDVRDAYSAWDSDPCDVDAANAVVSAINGYVDSLRSTQPSSITLIGPDAAIPHERRVDTTLISNERDFAAALLATSGDQSGLYGALAAGHVPSDDAYAAFTSIYSSLDHTQYLPDVAVGRVVESAAEIVDQVNQFLTADGVLNPGSARTAFVSGYDFLDDGANAQADALEQAYTTSPTDRLINDSWTSVDLAAGAFGDSDPPSEAPWVIGLGAHFDFDELIPADLGVDTSVGGDPDNYTTFDLTTLSPTLAGRVAFSVGCHSALNVPDGLPLGGNQSDQDWAQVMSRAGAVFLGNLGYGYGLDGDVGLSEELMTLFTANLDGSLTVGDALAAAKRTYFSGQLVHGAYDEKVLAGAALFGFPFWQLTDTAPTEPSPPPDAPTEPQTESFSHQIRSAAANGTYYTTNGPGGDATGLHNRPIQPTRVFTFTPPSGTQGTGVWISGLETTDISPFDVAHARPIVDDANREQEIEVDGTIFPNVFGAVNNVGGATNVILATGQFIGEGGGIQRLFTEMTYEPLFGTGTHIAPQITRADALLGTSTITFEIDVAYDGAPGPRRGLVLFKAAGTGDAVWQQVNLTETTAGTWTATAPWTGEQVEFFVQIEDRGRVGSSYNKGQLYAARLLNAGADAEVAVGETLTLGAAFVDVPQTGDPSAYASTVTWGDGARQAGTVVGASAGLNNVTANHVYAAPGEYVVEVCVSGLSTGTECDTLTATVTGVALGDAALAPITGAPVGPIQVGSTVSLTSAVDLDTPDDATPPTVTWIWGDGATTPVTGEGPVTADHTYTTPGVYPVVLAAQTGQGEVSVRHEFIVVFDPEGGFVTGGGFIDSPPGAYAPAPELTGHANFGFVAKYKKGQSTPDGNTQFQFKAAGLKFKSTSYDWLVIAGKQAKFKGLGTINGDLAPNGEPYRFFLVGRDGDLNNGTDPDSFRIKIWYTDGGTEIVVYDNKHGEGEDSNAATDIGGGSIQIHDGKGGKK